MKKILVITISNVNSVKDKGIYSSLYSELSNHASVDVFSINSSNEEVIDEGNVKIYKVKSKPIFKVNKFKKALNLLSLNRRFIKTIKKRVKDNDYDLILYSTPPITLNRTIKYLKKRFNAKTYLLLKDIFPQNAVDLKMFKKNSLFYKYFRRKESTLYKISDYVGVMSQGNLNYLTEKSDINKDKIEINPNSIKIEPKKHINEEEKNKILESYNIPLNHPVFIYGGNLGLPQGVDYILKVINKNENNNNHIVIVGDGTEKEKISNYIFNNNIQRATFIEKLSKNDYDKLLQASDVGLIFLDDKFTIPNIPSRLLSYLEYNKPVIAATDVNTDLKDIIEEGNFGYWCESENPKDMIHLFEKIKEKNNIKVFGNNGRKYLEENYDVKISAKLILDKLKDV